jgi:negative elongation factor C/D
LSFLFVVSFCRFFLSFLFVVSFSFYFYFLFLFIFFFFYFLFIFFFFFFFFSFSFYFLFLFIFFFFLFSFSFYFLFLFIFFFLLFFLFLFLFIFFSFFDSVHLHINHANLRHSGYGEIAQLLAWWLETLVASKEEVLELVENHLKSVVITNFDTKKADSIFHSHSSTEPIWLDKMLQKYEWRNLIYQLSEQHENCLMLNYAVQRIARDGFWKEIVDNGGPGTVYAACTSFPVFNQILLQSIDSILTSNSIDEFSIQPLIKNFVKRTVFSEHTYLYTQLFLHHLMQTPNAHHFKRLAQELYEAAKAHDPDFVVRVKNYLGKPDPVRLTGITSDISNMRAENTLLASQAVAQVYRAYTSANSPSPDLLQDMHVLDYLVVSLFCKDTRLTRNKDFDEKLSFLLALASSFPPNAGENFTLTSELKSTIAQTQNSILKATKILVDSSVISPSDLQIHFNDICEMICDYPVISMGIIRWVEKSLSNPNFYTTSHFIQLVPMMLFLLQIVAEVHILLRDTALAVLDLIISLKTGLDPVTTLQIHWQILDTVVAFAAIGHIFPVLQYLERWTSTCDQSYFRHVLSQILELSEPPYAPSFVRPMLRLMCKPAVVAALSSVNNIKIQFIDFIRRCESFTEDDSDVVLFNETKSSYGITN